MKRKGGLKRGSSHCGIQTAKVHQSHWSFGPQQRGVENIEDSDTVRGLKPKEKKPLDAVSEAESARRGQISPQPISAFQSARVGMATEPNIAGGREKNVI